MGRFDSLVQTVVIPRVRTKNTAAGAAGAPGSALASTSAAVLPSQPGLSPVQSSSSPSPALPSLSSLSPSALPSPSALASPSGKVSVADRMKWYVARVKSPKQQGLYGGLGEANVLVKKSESWAEARSEENGSAAGVAGGSAAAAAAVTGQQHGAEDDGKDLFSAAP
ncbi:hypothetical protein CLOM_g5613 [Closterium sp. NIES-68]|nr:hypothetical protein CLOM_g5328 [Closterium sp. NIES-68]GJP46309.1 hypothetical protein CLOM_g5613 [Closterium sp. NIES-68]